MSTLAKTSSFAPHVVVPVSGPRSTRIDSLDLLERLRAKIATARALLRVWGHRIETRGELRQFANELVRDTNCSHYDVQMELKKPFWRA